MCVCVEGEGVAGAGVVCKEYNDYIVIIFEVLTQ